MVNDYPNNVTHWHIKVSSHRFAVFFLPQHFNLRRGWSHVMCHMSCVTCCFFGQSCKAGRWRVCYHRCLPRLVFFLLFNKKDFLIFLHCYYSFSVEGLKLSWSKYVKFCTSASLYVRLRLKNREESFFGKSPHLCQFPNKHACIFWMSNLNKYDAISTTTKLHEA